MFINDINLDILNWIFTSTIVIIILLVAAGIYQLVIYTRLRYATNFNHFRGKTILITGGSSGIGLAIAKELYKAGAFLIMTSRDLRDLVYIIDEHICPLRCEYATNVRPCMIEFDMSMADDPTKISQLITEIQHEAPGRKIHGCIFSAGISMRESVVNMKSATENYIMTVNYTAPTVITRLLLQNGIIAENGHIAVISSLQGLLSIPFRSTYAASKHAVQAYFTSLRHELAIQQSSVSVTIISPGYVATRLSMNALVGRGERYGRLDENTAKGMDPSTVAKLSVAAIVRRYPELWLCPFHHQLLVYIQHWSTTLTSIILQRRGMKEYQHRKEHYS